MQVSREERTFRVEHVCKSVERSVLFELTCLQVCREERTFRVEHVCKSVERSVLFELNMFASL